MENRAFRNCHNIDNLRAGFTCCALHDLRGQWLQKHHDLQLVGKVPFCSCCRGPLVSACLHEAGPE